MSINNISILNQNPHYYASLMQSFLLGYAKPCELKILLLVLPVLLFSESRDVLLHLQKRSSLSSILKEYIVVDTRINGHLRFLCFSERYYRLLPLAKEAIVVLYSESKIKMNGDFTVSLLDVGRFKKSVKLIDEELKCAEKLGKIFSKSSMDLIMDSLGVM